MEEAGKEERKKSESENTHESCPIVNLVSVIPTLFCLALNTSVSLGK